MALTSGIVSAEQPSRGQLEKFHAQHLNNNFIGEVGQSFVLQAPGGHQGNKPATQTSKQTTLKKKHFKF